MERLTLTSRNNLEAIYGTKKNHVGSYQRTDKGPTPAHQSLHTRNSGGPKTQPKGVSRQTKLGIDETSKKSPRPGEVPEAQLPPIKRSTENKVVNPHTNKQTAIGSRQDVGGKDEKYDGNGRSRIDSPSRANQLSLRNNSSRSSSQSSGVSSLGKGTSPKTTSMQRGFSKTQKPSLDPLPRTSRNNPVKANSSAVRPVGTEPAKGGKFPFHDDVLKVKYDGTGSKLTNSNRMAPQTTHTSNNKPGNKPVLNTSKPKTSEKILDNSHLLLGHQASHSSNSTQGPKPVPSLHDNSHLLMGHQASHTSNSTKGPKPVPSLQDNSYLQLGHQASHTSNSTQGPKPVPSLHDNSYLQLGHQASHTSNSTHGPKPVPSLHDNSYLQLGHQASHTSNSTQGPKPVPSLQDNSHLLMGHQASHTSNSTQGPKPVPSLQDNSHLLLGHQASHTSNSTQGPKPGKGAFNVDTDKITPFVSSGPSLLDNPQLLMQHQAAHPSNVRHKRLHQAAHTSNSTQGPKPGKGAVRADTGGTITNTANVPFPDDMLFEIGHQAYHPSNSVP